nr:hypothetical protein [Pseudomonas avellanae]
MHQPVEDRIAQGRVADQRMPFVHRHLGGEPHFELVLHQLVWHRVKVAIDLNVIVDMDA